MRWLPPRPRQLRRVGAYRVITRERGVTTKRTSVSSAAWALCCAACAMKSRVALKKWLDSAKSASFSSRIASSAAWLELGLGFGSGFGSGFGFGFGFGLE